MKSIVQEASTIAKAVELGWREAGEPQEFSVKILEIPQHNFLGMTTRSAKVAVMFDGVIKTSKSDQSSKQRPQRQRPTQAPAPRTKEQKTHTQQPKKETPRPERQEPVKKEVTREITPQKAPRKKPEGLWNEELVACAQVWLTTSIKHMEQHDVTFTIEPQNFYLRITLNKPILKDEAKEKHLLASLSSLMLATVKKQFRKALRGHKIVLTHAQ